MIKTHTDERTHRELDSSSVHGGGGGGGVGGCSQEAASGRSVVILTETWWEHLALCAHDQPPVKTPASSIPLTLSPAMTVCSQGISTQHF